MAESSERVKRLLERYRTLKVDRTRWMTHWEDLARLMLPRRMGFTSQRTDGERRTEEIYDATAMRSARGLANASGQLARPEGEKWFFIRPENDEFSQDDEVLRWLRMAEEKLISALFDPKARFRQATGEADLDLVVFGTAVLFIGLSKSEQRLQFNAIDLKDVVIALNAEGQPDTIFYERRFTLRQAEQKFGRDKLSKELRERLDNRTDENLDEKMPFLRVVAPRPNGRVDAQLSRNLPFSDDWIEIGTQHEVSRGGFREFPFVVPRWDTSSGEVYGRSPGMIALPDAETLNAMSETILISGQKAADPPLFAPNEGSFDALNTYSGGISYYDVDIAAQMRGNPFFQLKNDFNLPITRDMQTDFRLQVEAAFFKNLFQLPVRGPEMTATEVITRKEDFIREIGAVFGRLESDYLAPMVERSFSMLLRIGRFDPIPEVLRGQDVRFEYTSPIKRIREQSEMAAAQLWVQDIIQLSTINQDIVDLVDADELGRFGARALDLPTQLVVSREAVEAKREARAQQLQEQQEREKVAQEAEIAATGGKAAKSISEALGGSVGTIDQILSDQSGQQQVEGVE